MAEIAVCLALLEAQIGRTDLGQLPMGAPPRKLQVRVHATGEEQMHLRGQMLQEEAQRLVNGRIAHHLVIIEHEDKGGSMRLAALQFLEQGRKTGDKRWRLGRLEQRHHRFPKARSNLPATAQGRDQRHPEAGRAIVQFVQRKPGDQCLVSARPGGKQRRFAKAGRSTEQGQRSRKCSIECREQALPLHQRVRQLRRGELAGKQRSLLGRRLRGPGPVQKRPGGFL